MHPGPGPAGQTHPRGFEARDPRTGLSRREHARGLLRGGRLLALESGRGSSHNSPCHRGQGTLLGQTRLWTPAEGSALEESRKHFLL